MPHIVPRPRAASNPGPSPTWGDRHGHGIAVTGVGAGAALTPPWVAALTWATLNTPPAALWAAGSAVVAYATVALTREVIDQRREPRGLGSWRVACGAPPLTVGGPR